MVVGDSLHGLFDELVAFVFEAFPVSVLARVDTATMVVVLGWRRRRSNTVRSDDQGWYDGSSLPVTIGWYDVVDAQLLGDFLDAQMQRVRFELLGRHVGHDGRRQAHQSSSLVLCLVAPSVALATTARTICNGFGVPTALQVAIRLRVIVVAPDAPAVAERDVVRSGDALVSPRHFDGGMLMSVM